MNKLVYLAGPILGLSYDEVVDRQNEWKSLLGIYGLTPRFPLRDKDFLDDQTRLDDSYEFHDWSKAKMIRLRAREDLRTSDLVIVDLLWAEEITKGTHVELGYADAWNKPVVSVIEPRGVDFQNPNEGIFLREISWVVTHSREHAAASAAHILGVYH